MPKPRKLGNYELLERIALGGMAEIYRARSVGVAGFERAYVLKLIHPRYAGDQEFIQMLVEEAKLTAQLAHHNIAQVTDLGLAEGQYYVAMEYVEGKDLSQVITATWSREQPMPIDAALYVAEQMCAGLHYAHVKTDEQGRPFDLVHRDISPQNVLLSYHGEVKIIDFGVAKAALGARPETRAGIIKGKFRYMSPEQAWGDPLDGRSDLFSVGLCLYEMLTGASAYKDEGNMHQVLLAMREAKITPIHELRPELGRELSALVHRALARHRHERYADARQFQIALADHLHRRFPGFTAHRLSELHLRLFPEAAAALGARASGGAGALGEENTDATVEQGGAWPIEAEVPTEQTATKEGSGAASPAPDGDRTIRQSIVRGELPTLKSEAVPSDVQAQEEFQEEFQEEVTELFAERHQVPDETSAMDRDRIGALLQETGDDAPPVQPPAGSEPWGGEQGQVPGRPWASGTAQIAPTREQERAERGAAMQRASLTDRAGGLRQRALEALQSERGRKLLMPTLGVVLALVVLLVVGLLAF